MVRIVEHEDLFAKVQRNRRAFLNMEIVKYTQKKKQAYQNRATKEEGLK